MIKGITSVLSIAEQVFTWLNTKESNRYIDECRRIKQDIQKEWNLFPNWDDSKIEKLWADLQIIDDALKEQIAIHNAQS